MASDPFAQSEADARRLFAAIAADVPRRAEIVLQAVGEELIAWATEVLPKAAPPVGSRLLTNAAGAAYTYVPPQGRREGPREQRQGGWADVSGQLALAYRYEVRVLSATLFELVLVNDAEYAVHLERRDGFWVLSGVLESGKASDVLSRRFAEVFGGDWPFNAA